MVEVKKAKNDDGYCFSCLDNKQHKRLYSIVIETYGVQFKFYLCEHCAKDLRDGINSPKDAEPKRKISRIEQKANEEKVKRQSMMEAGAETWGEDEE